MARNLPLVRLSSINPFLVELNRRQIDAAAVLSECGLPKDIPASSELFVSPGSIYKFVEYSAEAASDPYLGYAVGTKLSLQEWEPVALAAERAKNVGDFLNRFVVNALEHSSATKFFVRTEGDRSVFGFKRLVKPENCLAQNDAFHLGYISKLLVRATRDHWDSTAAVFRVADPAAIPPTPERLRIAAGDGLGMQVEFPTEWLFEPFELSSFYTPTTGPEKHLPRSSTIEAMRHALTPHLHEPNLTIERAAKICGHSTRNLAGQLRDQGTTIAKEIAKLREEWASRELADGNRRISDIANTVGFKDPTVFSRAFKKWTGMSPQEYRRKHRSPKRRVARYGKRSTD
jgi:AraC-like DNA-binding protein